jgi:hypothetical protein
VSRKKKVQFLAVSLPEPEDDDEMQACPEAPKENMQSVEARVSKLEKEFESKQETDFAFMFGLLHICIFLWGFLAFVLLSCVEFDENDQLRARKCTPSINQLLRVIMILLRDWLSSLIDGL